MSGEISWRKVRPGTYRAYKDGRQVGEVQREAKRIMGGTIWRWWAFRFGAGLSGSMFQAKEEVEWRLDHHKTR